MLSTSGVNEAQDQRLQMRAEHRQTHMLFGIATIFIIGHSLRIVLNIYELHWLVSGRGGSKDLTAACTRYKMMIMSQLRNTRVHSLQQT